MLFVIRQFCFSSDKFNTFDLKIKFRKSLSNSDNLCYKIYMNFTSLQFTKELLAKLGIAPKESCCG